MSRFILYFGGELQISADSTPTYIGGRNRPIEVIGNLTLEQLKLRIIRALRLNHVTHTVNLTCRLRDNGAYIATFIIDDEICEFVLSEVTGRNVIIYVGPEEIPNVDTNTAEFIDISFPEVGPSSQIYRPTSISTDVLAGRRSSVNLRDRSLLAATFSRGRFSLSDRPTFDMAMHVEHIANYDATANELADRVDRSVHIDYGVFNPHDVIQSSAQRQHRRQTHTQGARRSTSDASRRSDVNPMGADDFTSSRHSTYVVSEGYQMPSTFEIGGPSMAWGLDSSIARPSVQYSYASHRHRRLRQAPTRYTPSTDVIPRRRRT